jgi:pimeloyl-ACP methyl ester carboxylesterase
VVQIFAPAFSDELRRRAQTMPAARWTQLAIVSTGHSLGGGLAQQFAYSLPLDSVKHVKQVYAFDPSPVTGFYSVQKRLRDENKKDLLIDRIYERGEILAIVRSLTSLIHKPSAKNATIRGVRYKLFRAWNSFAAHSIVELAVRLDSSRHET